jgi:hypothetical protein
MTALTQHRQAQLAHDLDRAIRGVVVDAHVLPPIIAKRRAMLPKFLSDCQREIDHGVCDLWRLAMAT